MKSLNVKQQVSTQTLIVFSLAAGGLLLGLIGYVGFVSPAKSRLATVNRELAVSRTSLITAENTPPPMKQPPVHANDIFQMTKAMPNSDDWPGILIAVTKLADESKVKLTSIQPGHDTPAAGWTAVPLTVNVSGSYASVTRFLQKIKHTVVVTPTKLDVNSRLFVANGVVLTTPDGKSVGATITMSAFDYTPAAPAPPPAPTGTTSTGTTATTTTTSG